MKTNRFAVLALSLAIFSALVWAEKPTAPPKAGQYIAPSAIDLKALLGEAPADNSDLTKSEIEELLKIQEKRTPDQCAAAKANGTLTVYAFATVLGENFSAAKLPIADRFLSRAGGNISAISGTSKNIWKRQRPFKLDARIQPLMRPGSPSFPSGHATRAYGWAVILGEMFPEKKEALMARAVELGHERMLAGVHFPTDVQAGKKLGLTVAQKLLELPEFQKDLAAAKEEAAKLIK